MEELDKSKEVKPTFENVTIVVTVGSDPSVLTAYEQKEKMRRDEEAQLSYARNEGFEQGLKQWKLNDRINAYKVIILKGYAKKYS